MESIQSKQVRKHLSIEAGIRPNFNCSLYEKYGNIAKYARDLGIASSIATVCVRTYKAVSLTTVGYGDIYPVSTIGRCVTMISSLLGIALIALPAGIITAGYMNALQNDKK